MQNLLEVLIQLLSEDDRLVSEGKLLKNKVIEIALNMDAGLIKLLLKNNAIKRHFFAEIEGVLVFDKIKFQRFVSNKQFLPDSYTAFKNKIGLVNENGDYLSESREVVLAWPYKDCVLEGGQTKEDQKRDEIFWNETLAPDEIDRLLAPKVFTNFKQYDKDGEHALSGKEKIDFSKENLIIKGNNLLALHSLYKRFAGKVKLIYIDPPYNTGSDEFRYNDKFTHSTWLSFIKTRLEISKALLREKGYIWINCDDNESFYLKALSDNIFGRKYFIGSVAWKKTTGDNKPSFAFTHDTILIYGKNTDELPRVFLNKKQRAAYKNPDKDPRGDWAESDYRSKWTKKERPNLYYGIKQPLTGEIVYPDTYSNSLRVWGCEEKTHIEREKEGLVWWGVDGRSKEPKKKRFLSEHKGANTRSVWIDAGSNDEASQELKDLFSNQDIFSNPKPEKLVEKIINISTEENDIVLDFQLGSGTTCAVAQKMGRQYIGIEQLDYIHNVTVQRLKKVIAGEQGGISKDYEWQGGGSFIYCELTEHNEAYIDRIQKTKTTKELLAVWNEMQEKAFISYKVDSKTINANISEFESLSLDEQKRFLIEVLDKNQLYVNYSEIDDEDYGVIDTDKKLNSRFYGEA